jgi:hypothetical protein
MNKDANVADMRSLKQIDRQYGEQAQKPVPKKTKQKHRQDFTRMSVDDILDMEEEDYVI